MKGKKTNKLNELISIIGYKFKDEALISQALMSKSLALEIAGKSDWLPEAYRTLGDGVLDVIVMESGIRNELYSKGEITELKKRFLSNKNLTSIAQEINLFDYIFWRKGEKQYRIWKNSNKMLADYLEAIIGAAYLDGGMKAAKSITQHLGIA